MASGVEMMLKALGIDPAEIMQAMQATIARLQQGIASIDTRMAKIDNKNDLILAKLERLEKHLGIVDEIVDDGIADLPIKRISRQ